MQRPQSQSPVSVTGVTSFSLTISSHPVLLYFCNRNVIIM
ncbi:hypothetical protein CLOSTHATH_06619 [Hungatella hathewayi DSM 13479]|uniref:Uncharacterized protein n=1 Tax=Hungatella hathewayi DSM 13479 TaxID=566550 RepID=D3ASL1_9FIRM|nr:hypothetical protein CLOSTHATH_06619 [Hungatella hathewayi DSM 13479]